jgi:3-deoxy-7-phosphoheptulonate synthase
MGHTANLTDLLARYPLLRELDAGELESIAKEVEERWAQEGDLVVREGHDSEGLGLILSGQISVRVSGRELTRLGPGDMFGEMSALLEETAAADLVGLGPVHYVVVRRERCQPFLTSHPRLLYKLLQAQARRLRSPERWYAGSLQSAQRPAPLPSWSPGSWRTRPVLQQPEWPDRERLDEVVSELAAKPPLIFAGEARRLREELAEAAAGRAFLLQAGDCAESFREFSADGIMAKLKVTLQMAAVLSHATGVHVVKVGRLAGQFAKPRSSPVERVGETEIPSFRGDIVNDPAPVAEARIPDPGRMIDAYHQSTQTLNLLRALTHGGFASLHQAHNWNQEFVRSSREGRRYESIAAGIDSSLLFMRACGIDPEKMTDLRQVDYWTSHEALLLPYEEALTRKDSLTGDWYDCSAHMLWIGERTRQVDGAHVEFLSGVGNPIGCKIGPTVTPEEALAICERLNPGRIPGRLTLITRMGASRIAEVLPPLLAAVRDAGHPVVWAADPMHGNTVTTPSGRKTRRFDDVLQEIYGFFAACASEGTWPGGLHLELTGADVTECLGGGEEILEEDLGTNYATACDPRLNGRQSLDLAFRVAELLRASLPGTGPMTVDERLVGA